MIARDHHAGTAVAFQLLQNGSGISAALRPMLAADVVPDSCPELAQTNSISSARIGNRWSAFAPVELGVLSTTYRRLMLPASGLRRLAKSRA